MPFSPSEGNNWGGPGQQYLCRDTARGTALLKWSVFSGVLLAALWASARSNAVADDTTIVKGQCAPESHIAEGAIGDDLTKRQSRFFCDAGGYHLIGYPGMMEDTEIMNVSSVYLESGQSTPVSEGFHQSGHQIRPLVLMAAPVRERRPGR